MEGMNILYLAMALLSKTGPSGVSRTGTYKHPFSEKNK